MPDLADKPTPVWARGFVIVQQFLPQHLLSRLVGLLAECTWSWVKNPLIRAFIAAFKVDMDEAECPYPEAFDHFNAFFTRALKAGVRPLDADPASLLCPADGTVSECGNVTRGRLLQAKTRDFRLSELLGDVDQAALFEGGQFATIYLSPRDYHRVHMPAAGRLVSMRYIPGNLFSVNQATTDLVDRLFARNERLVCHFDTAQGPMIMVLVGAMIVAGIETVWAGRVVPPGRRLQVWAYDQHPEVVELARGEEMGRFLLGSTVILLTAPGAASWRGDLGSGCKVWMGEGIGRFGQEPDQPPGE